MQVGDRVIVRMQKSRKYGVLVKYKLGWWHVLMDGNAMPTKNVDAKRIEAMSDKHPAYNIGWRTA